MMHQRRCVLAFLIVLTIGTLVTVFGWEGAETSVALQTSSLVPTSSSSSSSSSSTSSSSSSSSEDASTPCIAKGSATICEVQGNKLAMNFTLPESCGIDTKGAVRDVKSLHHGVYLIVLEHGGKYVIKPECRPAAKWHGQQGWPEAATYSLSTTLFGENSTAPCARGVAIYLPDRFVSVIHSDGCGLDVKGVHADGPPSSHTLTGIALSFTPHDETVLDKALTKPAVYNLFAPKATIPEGKKLFLGDVSDILMMDYITMNADREDKNWFYDPNRKGRLVMMDNGWGYVGHDYSESVCTVPTKYLQCPPVLRHVAKSKDCKQGKLQFCVFRAGTVARVRSLLEVWPTLQPVWTKALAADPLIASLASFTKWEGKAPKHNPVRDGMYSTTLARYFHTCPGLTKDKATTVPLQQLLVWVALGVQERMKRLLVHVDSCVERHGAEHVLLR